MYILEIAEMKVVNDMSLLHLILELEFDDVESLVLASSITFNNVTECAGLTITRTDGDVIKFDHFSVPHPNIEIYEDLNENAQELVIEAIVEKVHYLLKNFVKKEITA